MYFCQFVPGSDDEVFEDLEEAFERTRALAIDEARHNDDDDEDEDFDESAWLSNHYDCGTIAAKSECVIVRGVGDPVDLATAQQLGTRLGDTDPRFGDEFGPAGAIAVVQDGGPCGWLFFGNATT